MSNNRSWLALLKKKPKKSKRHRSRFPWLETLERRELLYAALQNLQLYDDTA